MATKRSKWVKPVFSSDILTSSDCENPRKKAKSCSFESDITLETTKSSPRKKENAEKPSKLPKITENLIQSANWIDCFTPQNVDDLAVHSKKIQEIQDWIKHYELLRRNEPAQICLITGPAGSGKTATVQVVAKELNYQVIEWINPIDTDSITVLGDQDITYAQSQTETFNAFLFRSSRYKPLIGGSDKRIVLVEDLPNAYISDSRAFSEVLENYTKFGRSPLIFIVTDSQSKKLNISYNLFPEELKNQLRINHISFNAVSSTLMKKALKRISTLMTEESFRKYYKPPTVDMTDSIIMAAQGDLRNALINLHFGSLKGTPNLITSNLKTSSKSKSRSKTQKKLTSLGRDENITMMHALGRVFNPKYTDDVKNPQLLYSPEELATMFSTEPRTFVDFVHANYIKHFSDIESVMPAIDALTVSDRILCEYRDSSMGAVGLNVAVRGVMVGNKKPVTGWMPVRGPKRINIGKPPEMLHLDNKLHVSRHTFASDYCTYIRVIKNIN